ncbi:glycosyltransferase [Oceanihabitans sp. 2_MG-2023]|uniref:glycosyltransferase n=1 Tax=Oceanihabitans sp. 2_MG-2023 TaxID=3062661 RepID=UPI0026E3B9E2|nr:glycosyltransferase [Oceanihabitans sp. 2_MG-2023]MDO6597815.1 glycosyltransferase [Oceanihabitans sp. 2_MG-2023]
MNISIIIPAHNEEKFIEKTLNSLVNQTLKPKQVVIVNDNSTDNTEKIASHYTTNYNWISLVNIKSSEKHLPGSKVINAFYKGYETVDKNYDVICKFDADIILPNNYLEKINNLFLSDSKIGIAGGLAYIKVNNSWVYENIAKKTHVRGPFKAYKKQCFMDIKGLKHSIGWDTVDTLLASFYGWKTATDKTLLVKHLKPTGISYNKASKYMQGEAMYKMRYGFIITLISALKMAYKKRSTALLKDYMFGYFKAKKNNIEYLVTEDQGTFIRNLRWKGMLNSLK